MDDIDEQPGALVPGEHRPIRRVEAGESAFAGGLVADDHGQRVRVPAAGLASELWEFSAAEHVAGVRDLVRTRDGLDALLPWCADPVDAVLACRAAAGDLPSPGEIVTLVGSLLRGIVEVGEREVRGRWWLDDVARPLFVPGDGVPCAEAVIGIVERLRDDCADRVLQRVLTRIAEEAGDHRVVLRSLDDWEAALTELASPRPLVREALAPERVRDIPVHRARLPRATDDPETGTPLRVRIAQLRESLATVLRTIRVPARPAPVPRLARASRDTAPGGAQRHGRMLLVGAATAGAVLVGGLLWPGGDDSSASESIAPPAATPDAVDASPSNEPEAAGVAPQGDIEQTAVELLKTIDACREQERTACEEALVPGAAEIILERLGAGGAKRPVTLIEDYGDIAVMRLASDEAHGEQMLVMVRQKDRWLARDVYDVADQPSGEG